MLEQSDKYFKITIINMLQGLVENNMHKQLENFSRVMEMIQ